MNYASKQDMIDAFGEVALIELTDRTDAGVIDDVVLTRALDDTDAEIDSYVSARYDVTLARSATVLRSKAADIAFYKLHRDRRTDEVRQSYEDAIRLLRDIRNGLANLDIAGQQAPSAPADARVEGPDRMFSRDSLKGF